jgi:hypothetical protein
VHKIKAALAYVGATLAVIGVVVAVIIGVAALIFACVLHVAGIIKLRMHGNA